MIKVGGWVRGEFAFGANGNITWGPFNGNVNNRITRNEALRARGYITADVRNQTDYDTVRGYIAVGLSTSGTGLQVASLVDSANRAFVQWAGMTAALIARFRLPAATACRSRARPASRSEGARTAGRWREAAG